MREFGSPISMERREEILGLAQSIFDRYEPKREVRASEFAMEEDPDRVVVTQADVKWDEGRLRIAVTKPEARPPFEWLLEITSNVGETDYFKHYLVREDDVVLAQRKVLTPLDDEEADVVMADLRAAEAALKE
jgi:hypothetical protein